MTFLSKFYDCFVSEGRSVCFVRSVNTVYPLRPRARTEDQPEFAWGDRSRASALLSLSIAADHFGGSPDGNGTLAGDALAFVMSQYLNFVFVAGQPGAGFTVTTSQLQELLRQPLKSQRAVFIRGLHQAFSTCVSASLLDFTLDPTQRRQPYHEFIAGFATALEAGLGLSPADARVILAEANINSSYEDFGHQPGS